MNVLFLLVLTGQAQGFQNGIRKAMIKVKFSTEMTDALSRIQIKAGSNSFTTGVASIDAVAKATSATNMYRLFPYDRKNESNLQKQGLHLWYVVEVNEKTDIEIAVKQFIQLKEVVVASKIIDSMDSMMTQLNYSKSKTKTK
jgi:hypothetical protein